MHVPALGILDLVVDHVHLVILKIYLLLYVSHSREYCIVIYGDPEMTSTYELRIKKVYKVHRKTCSLRSFGTNILLVQHTRLSNFSGRLFSAMAPKFWKFLRKPSMTAALSLPSNVISRHFFSMNNFLPP